MAADDVTDLPRLVRPMLAATGPLPTADTGWAFELKWDGVRAVSYLDAGTARVLSRTDRDVTTTYPEVGELAAVLPTRRLVLDGELVALDAGGRPSFEALQARMQLSRQADVARVRPQVPVLYLVFDLLHLDGADLTGLPYRRRRVLLEEVGAAAAAASAPAAVPPWFDGDGAAVLEAARSQHLEGVVAKRLDSRYQPGRRSESWVKTKLVRTQDVVVAGWQPGQGRRAGLPGSLLLGVHEPDGLVFAGHVGTGFTDRALADLAARLLRLQRPASPFRTPVPRDQERGAQWVEPVLVGEVAFTQWTRDGRLRHPTWRGLRPDRPAAEVRREP